jgi:predicted secreted protein with PEFG-CTERM motif
MLKKITVFSTLTILIGVAMFSNLGSASGQIQNLDCPNCITIPEGQLGLYKELFPLVVWTDHTTYDHNSVIVVNGWVKEQLVDVPVTVNVFNPIGNVISVGQTFPASDGSFEFQFNTAGQLWKADGSYIIKVQSGIESRVFKTKVDLIPTSVGIKNVCGLYELTTPADNGGKYCLPYSVKNGVKGIDAYLYTQSKTLELKPRTFGVGQFTIDVPRDVLDSKSGNDDVPFTVLLNGKPYKYEEGDPKSDQVRRLQFDVPIPISGNRDKIEIVGTHVIPEFGTIAMMILGVAIVSIVALSARTKLMPRI